MTRHYDVIIIGSGPNGLAIGAYLSRAGQRVLLLEKRFEAGGGLKFEILPFLVANAEFSYLEANLDRNDQFRTNFQMYGPSVFLVLKY